jgi:hypothetical protein
MPHDPDDVLEALAGRIAQMIHLAAALDRLGRREQAATARVSAADLAHLLNLLRSPAGRSARWPPTTH